MADGDGPTKEYPRPLMILAAAILHEVERGRSEEERIENLAGILAEYTANVRELDAETVREAMRTAEISIELGERLRAVICAGSEPVRPIVEALVMVERAARAASQPLLGEELMRMPQERLEAIGALRAALSLVDLARRTHARPADVDA